MRIALRSRPVVVFGTMFVVALIAFLPMRLAVGALGLADSGISARSVTGSVWRGRFDEAKVAALPLGDLRASLSPFDLLIGRARVALSMAAGDPPSEGALIVSRHTTGFDVDSLSISPGAVFAPLPVSQLDLSDVVVRFEDGNCTRAAGRVRALVSGGLAGVDVGGPMSGEARCDAGALLLPLNGASGAERIALRITGTGHYHADLTVTPDDPDAAAKLALSGFRPVGRGYMLSAEGSLR